MTLKSPRPVFIIGCPRSGTTLLQQMLDSHPRVALPAETRFTLTSYQARCTFGDLREADNRRRLGEWITRRGQTKFDTMGLDPDAIVERIVAGPPTIGSAVETVFRSYASAHGKARWGDKRPSYFRKVPLLLRMFPDAQFVHLIRDGRDAVASLRSMPWYGGDLYTAALTWREAIDTGRRLARSFGPDTYFEFQYEHLVADPERELRRLCAFLGEDYDPGMTEPHHVARRTIPPERLWHLRTLEKVNSDRVGTWNDRFEPWELGLVETVLTAGLSDYGYALSGAPEPTAAQLARFYRAAARRWRNQRRHATSEWLRRRREPNPVESLLAGSHERARRPDRRARSH
ncbi:sulfotransferase [Actinomadura barringtoniae]|uniref:Sulfotransferase n=1 Tax=Actinomadura barringtoniae TaxID=1427535 RepID=A0A939PDY8_9ACTN|nr:sulfotransferase [Actinomadura barringtoniae]MBO2447929.1 sulfotransferase [Actinomadura barringtoniae]